MSIPIIEVQNLSKRYIIQHNRLSYYTLRDQLSDMAKKPLEFMRRNKTSQQENFWALKDVDFQVNSGEVLGIIGRNGAGKSTLLKILSRITPPTKGSVRLRGRVASLLEVGTGFNPELSGRENIFLNGAILGMTRKEIAKKFQEIVDFSGVEKFIDTPVKRYSSGMYVRLAFAVAAHLEPEILIVDEVLAVGDLEFQKKCLGKMEEVTQKSGRTVIFVSHNIEAIRRLCRKCILLEDGKIKTQGETDLVTAAYISSGVRAGDVNANEVTFAPETQKEVQILRVSLKNEVGVISSEMDMAKPFFLELDFSIKESGSYFAWFSILSREYSKPIVGSIINDGEPRPTALSKGMYKCAVRIDPFLTENDYFFNVAIDEETGGRNDRLMEVLPFRIANYSGKPYDSLNRKCPNTVILKSFPWNVERREL